MSCRGNHKNCHGSNGHGCEGASTLCVAQTFDEKTLSGVPSPSTFSGSSNKVFSNTPLAWDFHSEQLPTQSAQPSQTIKNSGELESTYKADYGECSEGSAEETKQEKSNIFPQTPYSFVSDVDDDSILTGASSVSLRPTDLSSPFQQTAKSDQSDQQESDKFKASLLESTLYLMKYCLNYPSLLTKFRSIVGTKSLVNCQPSLGPFAEGVLRKRAEREPPRRLPKPSPAESALWHINHQWKCRYNTLLDAIDLLYKDYQLLHHVCGNENKRNLHISFPERLLSSYSDSLTLGHDANIRNRLLAGADPVSYLANRLAEHSVCNVSHSWPHRFQASVCFILDVIAQCRLLRLEYEKMYRFRERIFRLTTQVREQKERLKQYMAEQKKAIADISSALIELQDRIAHMQRGPPVEIKRRESAQKEEISRAEIEAKIASQQSQLSILQIVLREEEAKRRHMHNRLQEITGNIRVLCRVRPHSPSRSEPITYLKVTSDDKLLLCPNNIPECMLGRASAILKSLKSNCNPEGYKCYIFDKVFGPEAQQHTVYKEVDDSIISCVDGFNVCIMAYGQTGSGKTHTMVGTPEDPGVNRRAIQRLLQICKSRKHWNYQLSMSMLEVYQEEVFDLLVNNTGDRVSGGDYTRSDFKCAHNVDLSSHTRQFSPTGFMTSSSVNSFAQPHQSSHRRSSMVRLLSTREDELVLQNLTEKAIESEDDMLQLIELGEKRRSTRATRLNSSSSRSHMLLLLRVIGQHTMNNAQSRGTLILADLAGSENVSKSGSRGRCFQEATCINKSLSCLARVFDSLRKRLKPAYRETKLTYLLKPTLGGDAKCLVLVNIRSEPENLDESLRALHFGQGALQVAPWKSNNLSAPLFSNNRYSPKPQSHQHPATVVNNKPPVRKHTKTPVP